MKEIGGYFGLEQLVKNEYYEDLTALNTARNALIYLMKAKDIKRLYIPYYLCNSISDILKKYRCDIEYYYIDESFHPKFERSLGNDEYIYIVNYYGQITNEKVLKFKSKYNNIILDNTHAFFQKPLKGVDTIYSCRKFFGVPDGAYLSTDTILDENFMIDISKERMMHILGRYEGNASDYYHFFKKNDESFRDEPIKYMSKLTHNILGAVNYEKVCQTRNKNYAYLDKELGEKNKLNLIVPDGPFSFPFYVEDGENIREKLVEKKIYIPTLWPNVLNNNLDNTLEYQYAINILLLPCDQRYNIKDMKRIINSLREVYNYV